MKIDKIIENGVTTVRLEGWLDIQSNKEFAAFASELPVQEKLVLDLGGLEYISSSGIREIISLILRQPEGSFSIINVQPAVMSVFKMIGLGKKVPISEKAEN